MPWSDSAGDLWRIVLYLVLCIHLWFCHFTDLLIEGGDVIILDGGVAARALGGKLTKVTILAEGCIVPLVKTVITELHENSDIIRQDAIDIIGQSMLRVLRKRAVQEPNEREGKEKDKDSVLKYAQSSEDLSQKDEDLRALLGLALLLSIIQSEASIDQ